MVGIVKLGAPSDAYRAYQDHATASVQGGHRAGKAALARFGVSSNLGEIVAIEYELESEVTESPGAVRIVAVQYLTRVYRDGMGNPSGRPEVLKLRHTALVESKGDGWRVADMRGEQIR